MNKKHIDEESEDLKGDDHESEDSKGELGLPKDIDFKRLLGCGG